MKSTILILALTASFLSLTKADLVIIDEPSDDRWMYPSNSTPGLRSQASTFSALPEASGLDDRWGYFLMAFDTQVALPKGLPLAAYKIKSVKLTATIGQDYLFTYDSTYDSWQTYSTMPEAPAPVPDSDVGRPVELHGAGFNGGWNAGSYLETSPYGSSAPGMRNAWPLGFSASGTQRDVSNNISQQFESNPWAVGVTDTLLPGNSVPYDTIFDFDIMLDAPGVRAYVQQALASGRIWLSLTSLHPATQEGGEFVAWYTKDDPYHYLFGGLAPTLEIDAELDLKLGISRSVNQVTLQWQEFAGFHYNLEASPNLSAGSWTSVHSHTASATGTGSYSEPLTETSCFYRLSLTAAP